jgi:hypothetical protein
MLALPYSGLACNFAFELHAQRPARFRPRGGRASCARTPRPFVIIVRNARRQSYLETVAVREVIALVTFDLRLRAHSAAMDMGLSPVCMV